MKFLNKDARTLIDNVVTYIKTDGKSNQASEKVKTALNKIATSEEKTRKAVVESAVELVPDEKIRIEKIVHQYIGTEINFTYTVKPELIGGVRVQIGDWILDTSIVNQLHHMQEEILS